MVLLAGQQTCDSDVMGSSPGWAPLHSGLGKLFTPCASVTKQCNLVPPKGVIFLAGKVTVAWWKVMAGL